MKAEMFWVKHKQTGDVYLVYEIVDNKPGLRFLVYMNNMWQYENAQLFEPYDWGCKGATKKKTLNEGGN